MKEEDMFEQAQLCAALGDPLTNRVVERLRQFAFVHNDLLERLATDALTENWGGDKYVLTKYLAVHIAWSIEQGRFTISDNQFYVTAGHLQTRYGTPLYLAFSNNNRPGCQPYCLVAVGSHISAPTFPIPPEIPLPPEIEKGAEIVMMHDHILDDNSGRVPFFANTPRVAQMCAIAGAIQWSINRKLQLPYWYYGKMSYVVPLYLQSRENIAAAPDLIAPIQVSPANLLVRTVLEPYMPFANARVAVPRHDQLPHWLLAAWDVYADGATEQQVEDPEQRGPISISGTS